jgi:hypothetical protein
MGTEFGKLNARHLLEMLGLRSTLSEWWHNIFDVSAAQKFLDSAKADQETKGGALKETNVKMWTDIATKIKETLYNTYLKWPVDFAEKVKNDYWVAIMDKMKDWASFAKDWVLGFFDKDYWLKKFGLASDPAKDQDRLKSEERLTPDINVGPGLRVAPAPEDMSLAFPSKPKTQSQAKFLDLSPKVNIDSTQDLLKPTTAKVSSVLEKAAIADKGPGPGVNYNPIIRGGDTHNTSNTVRNTVAGYANPLAKHSAANLTNPGRYSS